MIGLLFGVQGCDWTTLYPVFEYMHLYTGFNVNIIITFAVVIFWSRYMLHCRASQGCLVCVLWLPGVLGLPDVLGLPGVLGLPSILGLPRTVHSGDGGSKGGICMVNYLFQSHVKRQ